jgi:hypothetical protein
MHGNGILCKRNHIALSKRLVHEKGFLHQQVLTLRPDQAGCDQRFLLAIDADIASAVQLDRGKHTRPFDHDPVPEQTSFSVPSSLTRASTALQPRSIAARTSGGSQPRRRPRHCGNGHRGHRQLTITGRLIDHLPPRPVFRLVADHRANVLAIDLENLRAVWPAARQERQRFGESQKRKAVAAAPRMRSFRRMNEQTIRTLEFVGVASRS